MKEKIRNQQFTLFDKQLNIHIPLEIRAEKKDKTEKLALRNSEREDERRTFENHCGFLNQQNPQRWELRFRSIPLKVFTCFMTMQRCEKYGYNTLCCATR